MEDLHAGIDCLARGGIRVGVGVATQVLLLLNDHEIDPLVEEADGCVGARRAAADNDDVGGRCGVFRWQCGQVSSVPRRAQHQRLQDELDKHILCSPIHILGRQRQGPFKLIENAHWQIIPRKDRGIRKQISRQRRRSFMQLPRRKEGSYTASPYL